MKVRVKKFCEQAKLPMYATNGAAAADLCAVCPPEGIVVWPNQRVLIPTGIGLEIPQGFVGLIFARSSLGTKYGISLSNGVGVIDSDYRGEISVGIINQSDKEYIVLPGERIAQLAVMPVCSAVFEETEELTQTQRGEGGFGSTGRLEVEGRQK